MVLCGLSGASETSAKQESKPAVKQDAKVVQKGEPSNQVKAETKPEVKVTDLPGITTPDRTPKACVNCHANYPEKKRDGRLTVLLASWQAEADSGIVGKAQAAMPKGQKLKGKHPDVHALVKTIPDDCLMCHSVSSRNAPPFSKLLHAIHISGGQDSYFLTGANGTCTNCHKLDAKTGTWSIGSGVEINQRAECWSSALQ